MRKFNKRQAIIALTTTLLLDGKMDYELYEFEIEEHIEEFTKEMHTDKDEYVVIITEHSGNVAMALITKENKLFINKMARKKLKECWLKNYENNIKLFIPDMIDMFKNNNLWVSGIKFPS